MCWPSSKFFAFDALAPLATQGCDLVTLCPLGLQALGSVDNVFEVEAVTTARWIMNGRRYVKHYPYENSDES